MRARGCTRCKEYVVINPNDIKNRDKIDYFEKNHKGHALITLDFDEIKDSYKAFNPENP